MKQRHRTSGNGSTVSCRALDERNASAGQAAGSLPPATGRLRAELVASQPPQPAPRSGRDESPRRAHDGPAGRP
jgi:hypothetical protein